MVLSRSRMKYVWFLDKPFVAANVTQAHENAFGFFFRHTANYSL